MKPFDPTINASHLRKRTRCHSSQLLKGERTDAVRPVNGTKDGFIFGLMLSSRAIVDDDDLHIRTGLREYGFECLAEQSWAVAGGDIPTPKGHGQSFALNFGAVEAKAPYLCFLDDDDHWIDPNHLSRAHAVIADPGTSVDLYMTNQAAFLHGEQQPGPVWIEDLPAILTKL